MGSCPAQNPVTRKVSFLLKHRKQIKTFDIWFDFIINIGLGNVRNDLLWNGNLETHFMTTNNMVVILRFAIAVILFFILDSSFAIIWRLQYN